MAPSQSGTLDQIHASNSGATGLTSFHLGSPPPSAPAPLTFNKIYSKVKSVAAGVREAVREVVVAGPSGNHRSVINDSRESFEIFSSSSRDSPSAGSPQFKQHLNRLSLSNSSIMTKASTGSMDGGISPALRKVNILSPGPKSIPSPSLAQVTVFRNGTGEGETSVEGKAFNDVARKSASGGSSGVGGIVAGYSTPSPSSDHSVKYPPLQNRMDSADDIPRLGGDGATEKNTYDDSETVGNPTPSISAEGHAKDLDVIYVPNHNQANSTIPAARNSNIPPSSMVQATVRGNSILNPQKRKIDAGGPPSAKSMRKRPKSVKRTSESLLPGFTYNSESDTDEEEEDNISSPADNSSTEQAIDGGRVETNQSAISLIAGAGGVRALAGWFGVGRSSSEHQSNDHVTPGGASGPGNGGNIELALQQLRKGTLTREFWMKDENCKDCFLCGKTFNTFRRKHHCRRSQSYSFPSQARSRTDIV